MKTLHELKTFIRTAISQCLQEELEPEVHSGFLTLYHYSVSDSQTLLLNPEMFGKHAHSKREKNTSDVPRVFFYTDPTQREKELFAGNNLFTVAVPKDQIYDLRVDPLGLLAKYGRYRIHDLLLFLSGWYRHEGKWKQKTNLEKQEEIQKIKGVLYDLGRFQVVAWFEPIMVTKATPEEKTDLEKVKHEPVLQNH